MDRIDQSLDDIIKAQKGTNKAKEKSNLGSKNGPTGVRTKTIQKNSRTRVAVAAMLNLQYAIVMEASLHSKDDNSFELDLTISLPGLIAPTIQQKQVPKEDAVFTQTFRTMTAPIKEIFTSRYIPNVGPIKLVAINKNPVKRDICSPKPIHIVVKKESTPTPRLGQGRSVYRPADSYRPSSDSSHASRSNTPRNGSKHGSDSYHIDTEISHNSRQNQRGRRRLSYSSRAPSEPAIKIEREKTPALNMSMDVDVPLALPGLPVIEPPKLEIEPATIEIENLDPGTTAEDVKVVCSRFGEIKSCICTNGVSQVTYARKAAAIAAMQNLNGKTADNAPVHVPSPIAEPLRMVGKTVQGSINQAGALYADQLIAAQQMLKMQQHRMAQLQLEEQKLAQMRSQSQMGS
ncbi:hypothetical protein BGZ52_002469 [Haplosporangium bisporale]|nr:hypothetical protein BGZ52_002469 [Haplosporangium bisporale]KAF9214756.1 hypothetical protein BGZ59_003054 [Podila verticillata]